MVSVCESASRLGSCSEREDDSAGGARGLALASMNRRKLQRRWCVCASIAGDALAPDGSASKRLQSRPSHADFGISAIVGETVGNQSI